MEELVEKAKKGDEFAFRELVETLEKDLYRIGNLRLKEEEDIKDAIQNTMIYTYKNIKKLKNNKYFKTWVIRIYINECNKIYKEQAKRQIKIVNISESFEISDQNIHISNLIDKLNVYDIIEELEFDDKLIILLHYESGFTNKQISEILKININTAKSRLSRAIQKLRKKFEEEKRYERI